MTNVLRAVDLKAPVWLRFASMPAIRRFRSCPALFASFGFAALLAAVGGTAAGQSAAVNTTGLSVDDNSLRQWKEDFSDLTAFKTNWVPYGRLANGQWTQGLKARAEWWQVVDGALRGQNFPDEKHPAGITRRVAGTDLRLRCRIKIVPDSIGTIRFFGKSVGKFPPEKTDNHVTALQVSAGGLKLWNGNRLRDDDAPSVQKSTESGPLKKEPAHFHNTYFEKVEKCAITPGVWHDLQIEVRGRQVKVRLDDKLVLTFTLEAEQPMASLSLEVDGNKKEVGGVWFDDFSLEAL